MTRVRLLLGSARGWMFALVVLVITAGSGATAASAASSRRSPAASATRGASAAATLLASGSPAVGAAAAPVCAPNTTVSTGSGPVCGITAGGAEQWLGIPYAAAPVGRLRWRSPQPPAPWTATLHATAFGDQCVQASGPVSNAPSSEDCLFVNVVRPAGTAASARLPVLVHIHGGGFTGGNGNADYSPIATTGNEVVVSMNYRLNIFGFLAARALGRHSGDYGLDDQQAAMRWVQQNIRAFGGDPGNVTIYGESAGGSSVCDQIASPTARGLFEKAWSVSGEYSTLFGSPNQVLNFQDCKSTPPSQHVANQAGRRFIAAVGCADATNVAACVRDVPAQTVLAAAGGGFTAGGTGTISPTRNAIVLPRSLRRALVTGTANRVRVVAGTERDENLSGQATTADEYTALVNQQFGRYAPAVLRRYPLERFYSPFVAWRTVAADAYDVCPAIVTEKLLARRMPAWQYLVDNGDDPPAPLLQSTDQPNGNYHIGGWFLFFFPNDILPPPQDANQRVLQQQNLAYLTTLARTGNPTAAHTPVWPRFDVRSNGGHLVMALRPGGDSELTTTTLISLNHHCGFWNSISPRS